VTLHAQEYALSPTSAPATVSDFAASWDRQTLRGLHQEAELRALAAGSTILRTRSAQPEEFGSQEAPAAGPGGVVTPEKTT